MTKQKEQLNTTTTKQTGIITETSNNENRTTTTRMTRSLTGTTKIISPQHKQVYHSQNFYAVH